jgi:hypothetical protein
VLADANRGQYLDVWSLTTPGRHRTLAGHGEALTAWHTIGHLKTDSSGRIKWTHTAVHAWDYRMVVWSSPGSFLAVSNIVHR